MAKSLDQFIAETQAELREFARRYREDHESDPENYPLVLPDGQEGLWGEWFSEFDSADERGCAAEAGKQ